MLLFVIGAAGMLGAVLRYAVDLWVQSVWASELPLGTLLVNVFGCLALGGMTGWISGTSLPKWIQLSFGTGFIGSFTTFSTLSMELTVFIFNRQYGYACAYFLLSLAAGWMFAFLGYQIGRGLGRS